MKRNIVRGGKGKKKKKMHSQLTSEWHRKEFLRSDGSVLASASTKATKLIIQICVSGI